MKNRTPKSRMSHPTVQKSRTRTNGFLPKREKDRFNLNQPFFAFQTKTVFLILLFENRFAFLSTDIKIAEPSVEHVGSCRFGLESRMSRSYFLSSNFFFVSGPPKVQYMTKSCGTGSAGLASRHAVGPDIAHPRSNFV